MRIDYHVHTPLCGHAQGTIPQYIEHALACGLEHIGFADHCPRYYLPAPQRARYGDWGMSERDLHRYVSELQALRAAFAGAIDVRIGLEVDYVHGAEDALKKCIAQYPLDFILGSVHCLPRFGWLHLTNYTEQDPLELYREYFSCLRAALRSGLFSAIAHPDFIWRYVEWPTEACGEIDDTLADIARLAAYTDTALEMNANGYLWSVLAEHGNAPNPFSTLLDHIVAQRTVVSLGSDAHSPGAVGAHLPALTRTLRHRGITHAALFHKGKRSLCEL